MILWNSVFCVMTRGIFLPLSPAFLTRTFDDLPLFGSDWLEPMLLSHPHRNIFIYVSVSSFFLLFHFYLVYVVNF